MLTNTKLEEIFNLVFHDYNISSDTIQNLSRDNFPEWDSMKHLELIFKISDAFSINFSADDVVTLRSYQEIVKIVLKNELN